MAQKHTTAFNRTGKAMPGNMKLGNSKNHGAPMPVSQMPAPAVQRNKPTQTPNASHEVAFARNLNGPLGKGYKHTGGTSGSESITKGGK